MKKHSFSLMALLVAGSILSHAQVNNNDVASLGTPRKHVNDIAPTSAPAAAPSARAIAMFNKLFSNATNVSWSTENKGLPIVYFQTKGKQQRAGFDKKGNHVYTISYYKEEQLPVPVLLKIKQTYFGKSIFAVTEVNYQGKTAYLLILEDRTSWLHVKIVGDEMEVERVLTKG